MKLIKSMEKETRCDFVVTEKRKKLWNIELEILSEIERICEKYNLQYFALGGASIGAVRHQGFIPWDDDLDIGMTRSDLDILLKVAPKEFPKYYYVDYGVKNDNSFNGFCRIRDSRTTGILRADMENHSNGGIFVEIYPYDKLSPNKYKRRIQIAISNYLYTALTSKCYKKRVHLSMIKKLILLPTKALSSQKIWILFDKNCRRYNKLESAIVIDTVSLPQYAKQNKYYYKIEDIQRCSKMEFEETKIWVPNNLKEYLTIQYGDYMEFPSVEERGRHHENIVFYDPDKPYTEYYGKQSLIDFFNTQGSR